MAREKYKIKIDKKAFFYPEDMMKVLDVATPKQEFTIRFLLNTGARINEARHVDTQDLDEARKNITLRITKTRAKLGETRPDPRTIAVSTKFFKYVKREIKTYKILSTNQTGIVLKKLAKEVGVKNWNDFSAHNIRKTFGTYMLSLGVDSFKLAQHLGHSQEMLRTRYASSDIFNFKDKDIMRELLDDLPSRLRRR